MSDKITRRKAIVGAGTVLAAGSGLISLSEGAEEPKEQHITTESLISESGTAFPPHRFRAMTENDFQEMLDKVKAAKHPCCFQDHKGNVYQTSPVSVASAHVLYVKEVTSFGANHFGCDIDYLPQKFTHIQMAGVDFNVLETREEAIEKLTGGDKFVTLTEIDFYQPKEQIDAQGQTKQDKS